MISVLRKAKRIAMRNGMKYHLSAIVWRKRKPITVRTNRRKGQPKYLRLLDSGMWTTSHHAECNAIRFAKPGDVIEVLRWGKSGNPLESTPCDMCQRAMRDAGIKCAIYTDSEGNQRTMPICRS